MIGNGRIAEANENARTAGVQDRSSRMEHRTLHAWIIKPEHKRG